MEYFSQVVLPSCPHMFTPWSQEEGYMGVICWIYRTLRAKVSAALVIRGGSTTSNNEEGPLYRQHCPHLQAFTALFQQQQEQYLWLKRLWHWGHHRCFWYLPGLKTSSLRWKEKNGCYLVGAEDQFLEPPPFGDCCHTRRSMHLYPCFMWEFRTIWDRKWKQADEEQNVSLVIDRVLGEEGTETWEEWNSWFLTSGLKDLFIP